MSRSALLRFTRRRFTVLEILISIVVLSFALVGILGLLVASTRQAGQIVEDTFASTLARSVYESCRVGAREQSFIIEETSTRTMRGFLLIHEGVGDGTLPTLPETREDKTKLTGLRGSDNAIFLPGAPTGTNPEPYFVFPRPNGASDNANAGVDNFQVTDNAWGDVSLDRQRIYTLVDGNAAPTGVTITGGGAEPLPEIASQYGFCVVVRRAVTPNLLDASNDPLDWGSKGYVPDAQSSRDGLYELRIQVFRNFDPDPASKNHIPVRGGEYIGLLNLGP